MKIFRDISNSDNPPPIARSVENAFLPPLSREYGEEKAREIIKAGFTDALARPQT